MLNDCRLFYRQFIAFTTYFELQSSTCWLSESFADLNLQNFVGCNGIGEPINFYLEFVWVMGGITIFLLYFYATFLRSAFFKLLSKWTIKKIFSFPNSLTVVMFLVVLQPLDIFFVFIMILLKFIDIRRLGKILHLSLFYAKCFISPSA